jgi:hypothetical protein
MFLTVMQRLFPLSLVCLSMLAAIGGTTPEASGQAPSILAIARFDFRDTSGEVRDQQAEHRKRLEDVAATLLVELAGNERIRPMALACRTGGCSARTSGLEGLSEEAAAAGATLLLIGEVHKTSTLVGWMKFAVLEMGRKKAMCDRFLTYRGDTDEAWRRAARFAARDIERNCIP